MQAAIFQLLERGHNTRHRRRFSIMEEYRRWSMRMLSTTADCTPTLLCLQARKEIFLGLEGLVFERMIQVANTGIVCWTEAWYPYPSCCFAFVNVLHADVLLMEMPDARICDNEKGGIGEE